MIISFVSDIPGPPEPPFEISDIDSDACSLSWNKPLEDGGSNITNYVVEKCDLSRGDWVNAVSSCGKTGCRLGKLIPGKEYLFRARAENRFGISDPITSDRMVAKFPFGRFTDMVILHYLAFLPGVLITHDWSGKHASRLPECFEVAILCLSIYLVFKL